MASSISLLLCCRKRWISICSGRTLGTYQTYNSIDDKIDDFHYHTTYIKFGIGRATYDASQEVRSGDITREEGISLINKYDGEFPNRWADEIYEYLSIHPDYYPLANKYFEKPIFDHQYYLDLAENFRSPHLWQWTDANGWELRNKIKNENLNDQSALSWQGNK